MSCANPHISTRENLINLLQETRQKDIDDTNLRNGQTKRLESVSEDHFIRFLFCFLRVQNILYSRIGIDELETQMKRMLDLFKLYMTNAIEVGKEELIEAEAKKILSMN